MIGLALEGGGVRGSYQAGVYMAMYECNLKIDAVAGTSIGAINGAVIASGHGADLPKIWRSISMGHVFGFSDDFIKAINSDVLSLDLFKLTITNILNILASKGIELKGLKKVIEDNINVDDLMASPTEFGICTVKLKELKPLYLYKEDMPKNKVKEYILASAFLPLFKKEKLIDDNYYLDGGFYDLGPVNMLLNKGCKKVYLVKVQGIGHRRKYDQNADVTIIESKRSLGGLIELDSNRINENIMMGYYDTIRILKNYDGEKYVFKPKRESYYKFLNRHVSNHLYSRVSKFFKTTTYKDTTIKALEYVMEHHTINYYKIYKPRQILKEIVKKYPTKHFVYNYLTKLRYF